jgi:hypothetical protein
MPSFATLCLSQIHPFWQGFSDMDIDDVEANPVSSLRPFYTATSLSPSAASLLSTRA